MKKRVLFVLLTMIMLLPFIKVNAGNMDSYIDWNLDRSIIAHQIRDGLDHTTRLAMITANGVTAYCIEPGVTADKASYYSSTTNINEANVKNVDEKKLSLIGYYGYGYKNHTDKKYYMAAQELIWEMFGVTDAYWTDTSGNVINIDAYKNEILSLVSKYEVAPSFNFKDEYMVGDEFSINDKNNVLEGYEVVGNDNVSINGNSLKVKVTDGDNSFTLRRKENGKSPKYFYKNGYQTIGSFEFAYNYEKSYSIDHFYGRIIVDKMDADNKNKTPSSIYASLEGAKYGLYDMQGNLLQTKETNEDGVAIFDNLVKGNYKIKEISPSKGYNTSKTVTETFVGTSTKEVTIKSYEEIIKNKIVITKVLDDPENKECTKEEGILFGVYDMDGNLVINAKTDENGLITLELSYGKYVLKQESTVPGVDKVKDRIIEITEDGITQNITLVNHKLPKPEVKEEAVLPQTGKNSFGLIGMLITSFVFGFVYEKKRI